MTDYKGNEIKPGMEICAVKIIDRQMFRGGVLIPVVPGVAHIEHWEDKRPDRPCWEPGEYYKVNDSMCIQKNVSSGEYEFTCTIRIDDMIVGLEKELYVIAIKGISDTNPNE